MTASAPSSAEQAFLDDLDKKLWNAADRLRSNLDAAVYKHAVLGLIFLKYVSDAFDLRREELEAAFRDPKSDYFLDRADYKTDASYAKAIREELEDRDYYTEKNVFWVPPLARWKTIQENAALSPDSGMALGDGSIYTFRSAARLIDDALEAVEKENPRLKGVIEKNRYMQLQIEPAKLVGLISEVVSSIPFRHASLNAKDILGHVYEYFLGQFALAEGKKGGQYYTPKSIVSVIVEMLEPYSGKVYDPAMGSGGFFVQSEAFIEAHGGRLGAISVYGQESNPTTWRLAAMNMAIRGIDFNFGKQPADTFLNDQHTQGSGKSISMVCYAGKLIQQPEMKNPTLVVVTDRNDLDGQLYETFCSAQELLKQTPEQADSREELRAKLASRQAGGIIFTTIQKFALGEDEAKHPILCERSNVVVISDEAHRSQYGLKARLNTKTGKYVYGFAKHLRDALPVASFIGFTGTPIERDDKDTRAVFGDYISIYDIQDAVDDGATVEILYESRLAKLDVNKAEIEKLSSEVEDIVEEEDETQREKTKGLWSTLEKLVGAKERVEEIAADLVSHFETRNAVMPGKAMIVGMSRDICARLYAAIVALRPDWHDADIEKGAIKVVMTGSASDDPALQPHLTTKRQKKRLEKRFKNPADPLRLVIVRDMWLTGFDAPCCHTMYVDKPMKGHNLMQAIARVNRVFKDKPGGLVVDYIGIANDLKAAMKTYADSNGRGQPSRKAEDFLDVLRAKLDACRGLFRAGGGFDYSGYEKNPVALLVPAANHILGLPDGKKRFLDLVVAITRAFALCGTLDEAEELRTEIAFFGAVKAAIVKYTTVDRKLTEAEKHSALRRILDNAVVSEGVADIFALAGLKKPNIGLLSPAFLEDVRAMPQKNLAVELLEKLLRDEIKAHTRTNVVLQKKFGDRLLEALRKYHNRAIETAQVIEELLKMAGDIKDAVTRNQDLGLNDDEIAFYDALAERPEVLKTMGDATLKQLATELTEQLRASTTVDWQMRDSVRAKMRILIKRLLKKYKYPPEGQDEAVALVLQQAETLADDWSKD